DRPFVVPPHGTTQFDMTITANLGTALLKLKQTGSGRGDSIDYEINGGANLDLAFMHDLPFHRQGALSLSDLSNSLK
ncbi:MAG: LEA type 2 family protein, partial [Pseudomonadota bacterium]|nr:LEA type 2 family protein [Pseudomonadota bacterium]